MKPIGQYSNLLKLLGLIVSGAIFYMIDGLEEMMYLLQGNTNRLLLGVVSIGSISIFFILLYEFFTTSKKEGEKNRKIKPDDSVKSEGEESLTKKNSLSKVFATNKTEPITPFEVEDLIVIKNIPTGIGEGEKEENSVIELGNEAAEDYPGNDTADPMELLEAQFHSITDGLTDVNYLARQAEETTDLSKDEEAMEGFIEKFNDEHFEEELANIAPEFMGSDEVPADNEIKEQSRDEPEKVTLITQEDILDSINES